MMKKYNSLLLAAFQLECIAAAWHYAIRHRALETKVTVHAQELREVRRRK